MKKITVMIIIILAIVIVCYFYLRLKSGQKDMLISPTNLTQKNISVIKDSVCNSKNSGHYSMNEVENEYVGEIKKGMPIKVVLSCDHTKLTITGVIKQEIVKFKEDNKEEPLELVDDSNNVILDEDYNFDGYNDISTLSSHGQGNTAIYFNYYFLYNPIQGRYVFNEKLSNMENLSVKSTTTKTLYQKFGLGIDRGYNEIVWKWNKEGDLIKVSDKIEKLTE